MSMFALAVLAAMVFASAAVAATLSVPAVVAVGSQVQVQGCGYAPGDVRISVRAKGLKQTFSAVTIGGCLAPAYFIASRSGVYTIVATQGADTATATMTAV